jgi:hypothetical protein
MEFEKQINLYSNATNLAFISTALASIYLPPL